MQSQDKYHYSMDPPSHGDLIFYPSQIQTNMNISTFSLSSDPFEDRSSSMVNHDVSIRTQTDTALTSISDSINIKGVYPSHNIITTTTGSDGNSISTRSFSSGSSKNKKGQSRKARRAVGRGGVGNIINTDNLEVDYVDEADILRRRKLLVQFNPRAKISNTGRGGSGNILAASTSTPYDRSKDPDDNYEKLVHLEAQKKRMHQMVSTGRGGAGNVQNHVVVDASGGVRPRSKSLGMFNATTADGKKKIKISTPTSRPSTASTIASNANSEHYELRDYKLASSVASTPRKKFDPYARSSVNHNTNRDTPPINPTSTPPVTTTHTNDHSVGPNHRIDHNQTPTPTQPRRLAVSSAPPVKPVWKLQYQKQQPQQQQQPETKRSETTAREGTHDDKKTINNKGKWWKRSKKIDNDEEYGQIEHAHTDQSRHLYAITTDNLAQREAASRHPPPPYPPPKSSVTGIPRIAMRNPQIPSHISPESEDSRSLSPAESQILDEVRMLAESKVHKNGHFDMYDLEEILMQARQRHQTIPTAAYDRSSQPTPQPPQLPLPPPPQLQPQPPTAWHAPQIRTLSKQEQHVHLREHPERIYQRKERMMNGEFNHPPASSASIQDHPHAITTTATVPPSSYYSNTSSIYRVPASTVSDGDISEYSSVMSFERDTQSISRRSLKLSRRERQVYESSIELGPPLAMQQTANIHAQTRNLVKQRSDSAIGYYNNQIQEYDRRPDGMSELHRRQLALTAVSKPQPVIGVGDEEGGNWSLDPVNEEDGLYFIEDEEPYSSFIDL
ncbi:hypothetical protein Clacol_010258 [Clathrus columnatus]|uniref:Uncharacterized protein n=1 Tax=Clathrus columnatus TaxID=1419009 RepID=A0AAV5AS53_9AGAM|nr:hypothetical protein Clacol_010258 [Clathrus columnatus]